MQFLIEFSSNFLQIFSLDQDWASEVHCSFGPNPITFCC